MFDRLIGAHMPTGKGLGAAIRAGRAIGCTAVQVFTSSPQQWKAKEATPEAIQAFRDACAESAIDAVVSHDSYLINLCSPDEAMRAKSVAGLTGEMLRCAAYGIRWVVSHMGAHMGQGEEEGMRLIAENARQVLADTPDSVILLMETTAGQGSSLGCRFDQLARVIEHAGSPSRLGVCLDTCHVFAAGYDLRTPEAYTRTFEEFDRVIGLDRLQVIHCNDSKKDLGARVDRHAHLGEGFLGPGAFQSLMNDDRFHQVPIVVETPDAETHHAQNVAFLWDLAGAR